MKFKEKGEKVIENMILLYNNNPRSSTENERKEQLLATEPLVFYMRCISSGTQLTVLLRVFFEFKHSYTSIVYTIIRTGLGWILPGFVTNQNTRLKLVFEDKTPKTQNRKSEIFLRIQYVSFPDHL